MSWQFPRIKLEIIDLKKMRIKTVFLCIYKIFIYNKIVPIMLVFCSAAIEKMP